MNDDNNNNENNIVDDLDDEGLTFSSGNATSASSSPCRTVLAIPNRIWWEDGGQMYFDNEFDPFFDNPVVKLHILISAILLKEYYDNRYHPSSPFRVKLTFDECVIAATITVKISADTTLVQPTLSSFQGIYFGRSLLHLQNRRVEGLDVFGDETMEMDKTEYLRLRIKPLTRQRTYFDAPADIAKLHRVREIRFSSMCRSVHPEIACMVQLKCIEYNRNSYISMFSEIPVFAALPSFPTMTHIKSIRLLGLNGPSGCDSSWYRCQFMSLMKAFPFVSSIYLSEINCCSRQQILNLFLQEGKMMPFNSHLKYLRWPSLGGPDKCTKCVVDHRSSDDNQLNLLLFDVLPEFPNLQSLGLDEEFGNKDGVRNLHSILGTIQQKNDKNTAFTSLPHTKNLEIVNIQDSPLLKKISIIDEDGFPNEVSEHDVADMCTFLDYFNGISNIITSPDPYLRLDPRIECMLAINGSCRRVFNDQSITHSVWPTILARIQRKARKNYKTSVYYALRYGPALCGRRLLEIDDSGLPLENDDNELHGATNGQPTKRRRIDRN